jgi:hypothetical protein
MTILQLFTHPEGLQKIAFGTTMNNSDQCSPEARLEEDATQNTPREPDARKAGPRRTQSEQ